MSPWPGYEPINPIGKKANAFLFFIGVVLPFLGLLAIWLSGCAPLFIAAGVEIEHDEWCKTHMTDSHCK